MKTYTMTIAGCERELPICKINDNLSIAAFIIFGDVEITQKASAELLKRCPEFDVILTAEAKGIPLGYEMASQSNKPYAVARKGIKLYLVDPIEIEVKSITTEKVQKLYLSRADANLIKGKRVLIVDDVISTGESLQALEKIVEKAGGKIVTRAAVLAEGDATQRDDITYLEPLPLFKS
jgi:adenine phosphoribosyltransferase